MRTNHGIGARSRQVVASLISSTLLLSGCASSPKPVSPAPSRALSPRDRVEVWTGGTSHLLHGVRFTADSVTGVPYLRPPDCDSCRVSLTLSTVDSMKTAPGEGNAIAGVFAPVVFLAAFMIVWRIVEDD